MDISKKIIPFTCFMCGFEFVDMGGGICSICKRPVCIVHLSKTNEGVFCIDCKVKEEEKEK
ncbi:MAG: hypothetical protein NT056_04195, partial [Proteobacteria bacterium]|nr:hypothetical protein [Pseudomonadota bacterium]